MLYIRSIIFCFLFIFLSKGTYGQNIDSIPKPSLFHVTFKDTAQKDINDIIGHIFNKKKRTKTTLTSPKRNLQLAILPAIGYALQTGFAVVITGNGTFSTNRKDENQKSSTIFSGITYSEQNQIIFPLNVNIWTKKNRFNIISDNRFIRYPAYVFGVGNSVDPSKKYNSSFSSLRLHQSILKDVSKNFYLGGGIMYDQIWDIGGFDSIYPIINPGSSKIVKSEIASGFAIRALFDSRLNQLNSSNGLFANIIFRQNTTALGSNYNWSYLSTDIRAYIPFPRNSKNILALWNFNWLSFGGENVTNYLLPSNGWDDTHNTGRGYLQGRFRGRNMFYLEAEYRIRLTKNGLLGATIFANAQHYQEEYFRKTTAIKPGGGMGLRIKFNKYSRANLCIDYGIGQDGSRGFFVNIGEVF